MALILNLPILKENPIIIAETRPQKINLYLTNLRAQNPLELSSYLLSELNNLNRQKVSPANRIQALDTYRPMLISTCQALAEQYSDAALPLQNQAKSAASAAESLWLELGYGYKPVSYTHLDVYKRQRMHGSLYANGGVFANFNELIL